MMRLTDFRAIGIGKSPVAADISCIGQYHSDAGFVATFATYREQSSGDLRVVIVENRGYIRVFSMILGREQLEHAVEIGKVIYDSWGELTANDDD